MKNHEKIRKKFGNIAAVVFAVLLGLMTPPEGLTPAAMRALGIICGAILLFIVDSIPSHIVTILMCTCFALFGVATIPQAFSAYSSGTWWLIVGVLGIGIAVNNCGLLKRLSFYAMKLFPPTYGGMIFSLLGIGTLFSPLMPSTTAKQTIVAPIAMKIGENLGLEKRSKGMAGLFNAMYIGWAVIGTAFMSASFVSYQMIAALPEKYRGDISWTSWLVGMIPWGIVIVACSYFMLVWLYKPAGSGRVPDDFIDAQIKALGPLSRNEKLASIIFGITLCFWITEELHGISSTLTALVCLAAMAYFNLFDVPDFNAKMMWSFIFYIGGILNIGTIIGLQKIDIWVGDVAGPAVAPLASRPYLFAVAVAVFVYSTRFVMISFSSLMVIVTIFLSPIGAQYGIHPWTTGIMAYSSSLIWVALYQNANMLAGWAASGADENLDFKHVRPGAIGYLVINILGLLVSVCWWRILGYIQ